MTKDPNSVMITGVAGLIGSFLTERLLANGTTVYAMDIVDLATCRNLDLVRDHPNFHYSRVDIRAVDDVRAFYRPEASVLYHLASVVGVNRYMEDPLSLIDIAILGLRNVLKLAEEHGTRVLFTSTSEVYGRNPAVPWREEDDRVLGATNVDRWSYSTSKAMCEHMLFGIHRKAGLPVSIVRFFNVYGPRQNPIYVVSKTVQRVLNGHAPEIYDGGKMTRCLTYVEDVMDGVIAAATQDDAIGEIFNLGRPVEMSANEIVQIVLEETGSDLEPIRIDTGDRYGAVYEDILRRVPAVDKAKRVLGWEATTSAREGIAKTIAWARENDWYLK